MGTNKEIKAIADLRGISIVVHPHATGFSWMIYDNGVAAVWGYTVYKNASDAKAKGREALRLYILKGA